MKEMIENSSKQPETYLPFVRKIAGRMARRLPKSVEIDDLMSAGTVGLMEALDRFDPKGGRSFETYAEFRVKGAMLDELRRGDPINRSTRMAQSRLMNTMAQLTSELGRRPEAEEMAAALNTTVDSFMQKMSPLEGYKTVPLDAEIIESAMDLPNQEDQLAKQEIVRLVRKCIEKLTMKQQLVLSLYYVEELNQAQIGQVLKVTESRVCQILTEAIKQLRKHVKSELE